MLQLVCLTHWKIYYYSIEMKYFWGDNNIILTFNINNKYYLSSWNKTKVLQFVSPVGSSGTKLLIKSPWTADCWFVDVMQLFYCFVLHFLFQWIAMFSDYLHLQHGGVEFCRAFINLGHSNLWSGVKNALVSPAPFALLFCKAGEFCHLKHFLGKMISI
jgi:hypothetical protein